MSLNALRVALQGAGFPLNPIALAVQGLLSAPTKDLYLEMLQAGRSQNAPAVRDYVSENLLKLHKAREPAPKSEPEDYNLTRLHAEDAMIAEFIVALVTKGFLNGRIQCN
jgi:hypothetical protein